MSAQPSFDREARADQIARCGARLAKFVEIKAPEIVIESARMLLLECLIGFPVNAEAQAAKQEVDTRLRKDECDHLMKTGYYDDDDGATP